MRYRSLRLSNILLINSLCILNGLFSVGASAQQPELSSDKAFNNVFNRVYNQVVAVQARSQPVEDVLRDLRAADRPPFAAGGEAAWDRMTLYAQNRPLSEVLTGIGRLFNEAWLIDVPDQPDRGYTLYAGQRIRAYENDLWLKTLERNAGPLFKLPDYLRTSAEEWKAKLTELYAQNKQPDDPLLRLNIASLCMPGPRAAIGLLGTLSDQQRFTLLSEERCLLDWDALTPDQQELVSQIGADIGAEHAGDPGYKHREEKVEDSVNWLKRSPLMLELSVKPGTGLVDGLNYSPGMEVWYAGHLNPAATEGDLLPVRGNPYHWRPNSKVKLPIYRELESIPFPSEFKLDVARPNTWAECMTELSKYLKIPIFSDDYVVAPTAKERAGAELPSLKQMNLVQGLDALCNHYRYLWWYDQGALYFRSRTWFIDRAYVVPLPTLKLLRRELQANGRLDIQGLDALSQLTWRQLVGLSAVTGVEKGALDLLKSPGNENFYEGRMGRGEAERIYSYLRAWSLLDDSQKRQALTMEGLSLTDMRADQRSLYLRVLGLEFGQELVYQPELRMRIMQRIARPATPTQRLRECDLWFTHVIGPDSNRIINNTVFGISFAPRS